MDVFFGGNTCRMLQQGTVFWVIMQLDASLDFLIFHFLLFNRLEKLGGKVINSGISWLHALLYARTTLKGLPFSECVT